MELRQWKREILIDGFILETLCDTEYLIYQFAMMTETACHTNGRFITYPLYLYKTLRFHSLLVTQQCAAIQRIRALDAL